MSWHVDHAVMQRYADGTLDHANAASIEAHLMSCASCRAVAADGSDRARLEATWVGIVDAIDRPRERPLERLLRAMGVRGHIARLVGATPSLQTSWFAANSLVLAFATAGAHVGPRGVLAFLALAPLIPLAGIALAYGPGIDPAYEVAVAAPLRGFRLLMLRAGTVLVTSMAMMGVASIWLPAGWRSAAWLLPALGLSLIALMLGTWIDPLRAASAAAVGWIAVLAVVARAGVRGGGPILERMVLFNPEGQAVLAAVVVVAAITLALRARANTVTQT